VVVNLSPRLSHTPKLDKFPGAVGAMEPHRSIPNSEVKRCCGEDTWRVTAWENSSVPGLIITSKLSSNLC
jgi:hypothetical protein